MCLESGVEAEYEDELSSWAVCAPSLEPLKLTILSSIGGAFDHFAWN
jgi:hypothetical protein